MGAGAVESCFGAFPLGFQGSGAFAQNVVEFHDAIFDRAVEPLQAVFGITYLPLQGEKPAIDRLAPGRLALHKRSQKISDPVRYQDAQLQIGQNDLVEDGRGNMTALTNSLALLLASCSGIVRI